MIIVNLILLGVLIYIIFMLLYSMVKGAPFAALSKNRMDTMFELLSPVKGKRFVDLGSGDGRIVIAAAGHDLKSYGYEINPLIVLISLFKIKKSKVKNCKIILGDYWRADLSKYDYISVWGFSKMMPRLEKKLLKELKPGAKVVSNHYQFPNLRPVRIKNGVYLYQLR